MTARAGAVDVASWRPLDGGACCDRPDKPPRPESEVLGAVVLNDGISTGRPGILYELRKNVIDTSIAAFSIIEFFHRGVRELGRGIARKKADPALGRRLLRGDGGCLSTAELRCAEEH